MSPPPSMLGSAGWLLTWALLLATPFLAWALAALLIGPGPNSRWRRAASPVGRATWVSLAVLGLFRVAEVLSDAMQGGPLGWLTLIDQSLAGGVATRAWLPGDAILLLAIVHAALVIAAAPVLALFENRAAQKRPFRVPLSDATGLVLMAIAIVSVLASQGAYLLDRPGRMLLDLAAALPIVCVALSIWTRTEKEASVAAADPPRALGVSPPPVDVAALWRKAGVLVPEAPALLSTPGAEGGQAAGWSAWAWRVSGGLGPPPRVLEEICSAWAEPGKGWLVGDLPAPTERHLLTSFVLLASLRDAMPCVVIGDEPKLLRNAVVSAMATAGAWSPGPITEGEVELREVLAGNRMPAAAFLDVAQLSSAGIRALAGTAQGRAWGSSIGLVVLPRVDRGTPVEATHRFFTLRRLDLALTAAGSRFSVVASGVGGPGTRGLVERLFRRVSVREAPFGPRASAPVRVWRLAEGARTAAGPPWVRRAIQPVVDAKLPVSVGDPTGAFDSRQVDVWGGEVHFARDICLDGAASVSSLDEGWLVAAYRALAHRSPLPGGQTHHALWALADNPVTRFLTADRNLENFANRGRLLPPSPVVGFDNKAIAVAHLRAALHEQEQDLDSLQALFGKSRVDQVLRGAVPERQVVRSAGGDRLERSPLVPASATEPANPLRATVTEDVVRILDVNGQNLTAVDRLVVGTRFYSGRVFAIGDSRYEVPLHAYDEKRGELRVRLANDRPLSRPQLRVEFESPVLSESVQTVHAGRINYQVCSLDVTVVEQVTGYFQPNRPGRIDLAPVSSRYPTRVRAVLFPAAASPNVLYHLARTADGVLMLHLLATDEDVEVVGVAPGQLLPGHPGGLAVVDRHIHGMGVAEALDLPTLESVLLWVRAILGDCKCGRGCGSCTPGDVLELGPDKVGVLRLLG